jgi:hypothetical protein
MTMQALWLDHLQFALPGRRRTQGERLLVKHSKDLDSSYVSRLGSAGIFVQRKDISGHYR